MLGNGFDENKTAEKKSKRSFLNTLEDVVVIAVP
jgi:hypothetical protein